MRLAAISPFSGANVARSLIFQKPTFSLKIKPPSSFPTAAFAHLRRGAVSTPYIYDAPSGLFPRRGRNVPFVEQVARGAPQLFSDFIKRLQIRLRFVVCPSGYGRLGNSHLFGQPLVCPFFFGQHYTYAVKISFHFWLNFAQKYTYQPLV